ncbi:putative Choline dehydrogenase, mitochondrial [Glarea lozoyensis 74030]|uniref:Putative Choline dehydrogenase, mitochondrial n=1 Tax=Glarea lozoyensis (strain ATCC 74030 / MF5533) TaxID=1104152 RepID=H0EKG2_GLAL7|nr:putative Choline dehydrogenase, mitochondrial [Glarea lozoyensis 74030]
MAPLINILTFLLLLTTPILSTPTPNSQATSAAANEYDYIVIGSGPGGGTVASNLARANYTVLLLDAGDQSTANTGGQYPAQITWDFFIEHNNYLPKGTAGHGFDGFFQTMMAKPSSVQNPGLAALNAAAASFGAQASQLTAMLSTDPNAVDPNRDQATGIFGLPSHTRSNGQRYSSRDYILDTINLKYPLTLSMNSLATRILFNTTGCTTKPRATGVEYLAGKSLYKADPRYSPSNKGILTTATARKEVILSGGAFNTPQLLMLSGIGPPDQLSALSIPLLVSSPGVGKNMQDNQEVPTVGQFPSAGMGSAGGCIMRKTPFAAYDERDVFIMQFPGVFRGFWPSNQTNTKLATDPQDVWTSSDEHGGDWGGWRCECGAGFKV